MIEVIAFKEWHLNHIQPRTGVYDNDPTLFERVKDLANHLTWTIVDLDYMGNINEYICCGGFLMYWPGVMEGWMITSDKLPRFGKEVTVRVIRKIEEVEKMFSLRRLQMTVRADFEIGQNWAAKLGFKREGILKKFGPEGCDYIMYARVKE